MEREGAPERINYWDLEPEEIGHVYEGILPLAPKMVEGRYTLEGHLLERKAPGSYCTSRERIELVLEESPVPTVKARLKEAGEDSKARGKALLSPKVLDPAVGSGASLISGLEHLAQKLLKGRGKDKGNRRSLPAGPAERGLPCPGGGKLPPPSAHPARYRGCQSVHRFSQRWLEFPEGAEQDGFDVVLRNPPWEKPQLQG